MALGHLLDFSMLQFSRLHNKELIRVSHPLSAASLNQITHRELVTPLHWASSMCSLNASYCCPYTINKWQLPLFFPSFQPKKFLFAFPIYRSGYAPFHFLLLKDQSSPNFLNCIACNYFHEFFSLLEENCLFASKPSLQHVRVQITLVPMAWFVWTAQSAKLSLWDDLLV